VYITVPPQVLPACIAVADVFAVEIVPEPVNKPVVPKIEYVEPIVRVVPELTFSVPFTVISPNAEITVFVKRLSIPPEFTVIEPVIVDAMEIVALAFICNVPVNTHALLVDKPPAVCAIQVSPDVKFNGTVPVPPVLVVQFPNTVASIAADDGFE